ncbi:MAG: HPr(Ser) kinase/phosphatase [Pseudomonadota bacterium]
MNGRITSGEIFAALKDRFSLTWAAGQSGAERALSSQATEGPRPSLAGFLNVIHPNNIQILGAEEVAYLDTLEARQRWESIARIVANDPIAVLISDSLPLPDDLREAAEESGTPLWASSAAGVELVSHLQHMLSRRVARNTSVHGVFMEVFSLGVLITGDSGAGKSELALELITRGHRLVADDAPDMTLIGPDVIDGTCPPLLRDCLEVRGLGVLNVRAMFGDSAIIANKYLRLIIHLRLMDAEAIRHAEMDRLRGEQSEREILGIGIPQITVPVAPGRNLAVLVEAAVRNHGLKMSGYDAADEFLKRHQQALKDQS